MTDSAQKLGFVTPSLAYFGCYSYGIWINTVEQFYSSTIKKGSRFFGL